MVWGEEASAPLVREETALGPLVQKEETTFIVQETQLTLVFNYALDIDCRLFLC